MFSGLLPGTYTVLFTKPAGYIFIPRNQGGNPAGDRDPIPPTGPSDPINLAAGQAVIIINAGMYIPYPSIELLKSADKSFVLPGGQVTYTYMVRNTGGVTITNVTVVDDNGTPG